MRYPNSKKYNIAIWLPKLDYKSMLNRPGVYSKHIKDYLYEHDHKHNFDYRDITMDKVINGKVVEIESVPYRDGIEVVYKLVVRTDLDPINDLVVVIGLKKNYNEFITAWINEKKDTHKTLRMKDVEKYPSKSTFYSY